MKTKSTSVQASSIYIWNCGRKDNDKGESSFSPSYFINRCHSFWDLSSTSVRTKSSWLEHIKYLIRENRETDRKKISLQWYLHEQFSLKIKMVDRTVGCLWSAWPWSAPEGALAPEQYPLVAISTLSAWAEPIQPKKNTYFHVKDVFSGIFTVNDS